MPLPDNVVHFSSREPQSCVLEDLGVIIHGQSYRTKAVTDTVTLSAIATPIAGLLGVIVAFLVVRRRFLGRPFAQRHCNRPPQAARQLAELGFAEIAVFSNPSASALSGQWISTSGSMIGTNPAAMICPPMANCWSTI